MDQIEGYHQHICHLVKQQETFREILSICEDCTKMNLSLCGFMKLMMGIHKKVFLLVQNNATEVKCIEKKLCSMQQIFSSISSRQPIGYIQENLTSPSSQNLCISSNCNIGDRSGCSVNSLLSHAPLHSHAPFRNIFSQNPPAYSVTASREVETVTYNPVSSTNHTNNSEDPSVLSKVPLQKTTSATLTESSEANFPPQENVINRSFNENIHFSSNSFSPGTNSGENKCASNSFTPMDDISCENHQTYYRSVEGKSTSTGSGIAVRNVHDPVIPLPRSKTESDLCKVNMKPSNYPGVSSQASFPPTNPREPKQQDSFLSTADWKEEALRIKKQQKETKDKEAQSILDAIFFDFVENHFLLSDEWFKFERLGLKLSNADIIHINEEHKSCPKISKYWKLRTWAAGLTISSAQDVSEELKRIFMETMGI